MNEIFDIKRWGRLLQYEVVNYMPRYFKSLLIFTSVIVAAWLLSVTADFEIMVYSRVWMIAVLFVLAIVLAPYIIYKDMNNRKRGYLYAMIPASTLEKLLSMLVVCLICVPVVTYATLTATDILLNMLSRIGLGSFAEISFFNPFTDNKMITNDALVEFKTPLLYSIIYYLSGITYAMMFNTIFRKNKVMKTILFNIALTFTFVILMTVVASMTSEAFWQNFITKADLDNISAEEALNGFVLFWEIAGILFILLHITITYFRIKKVNY